jgi:hypothetical protein
MEDEVLSDVRPISRSEHFRSIAQKWQARAEEVQEVGAKEQYLRLARRGCKYLCSQNSTNNDARWPDERSAFNLATVTKIEGRAKSELCQAPFKQDNWRCSDVNLLPALAQ